MNRNHRFDPFDTHGGKYSSHKIPKWQAHNADLLDYMHEDDDFRVEPLSLETFHSAPEKLVSET